MKELYSHMGFRENPFSRYSAEEEKAYLKEIFVQPRYYPTIYGDIKSGLSRFVFGERGIGKTALVLNLKRDLQEDGVFTVFIDEYDGIEINNDGKQLLYIALQQLVTEFSLVLIGDKRLLRKLSKDEIQKLSIFVNSFFKTLSKKQFSELYDRINDTKRKNRLRGFFNWILLKPVNALISSCSEFVGSSISKALGLPTQVQTSIYKEYVPELKEVTGEFKIELNDIDYKTVKTILFETSDIIRECGFTGVVVILDKIDEYRLLGTQLSNIAQFSKTLVQDTALLLNDRISFVFSFWSRIRLNLTDLGVRYDKLKPIDITWWIGYTKLYRKDKVMVFS